MENEKINKYSVMSSLMWRFIERGGTQGISFIVSIILARLVLPEEYGLISLITIFISLANVFVQKGFSTALIQKKNVDDIDYSTVFYMNLIISMVLYLMLVYCAPAIAKFYEEPILVPLLKIISITLFLGAINSVQIAIVTKRFEFKKLLYSSLTAITISGIIGIILAINGFGVWALVGQQIINQLTITIVMWFKVKWRPKCVFSLSRLKDMFTYGSNMLITNLISTLFWDIRSLVIGKFYTASMLAYFNRGKQFPSLIIKNIDDSIQSVMLPTYAHSQDNKQKVKNMMRRSLTISSFIIFPIMIGLGVVAEPIIRLLLTDKWLESVIFMQIFCISYMITPINTANLQAIKGLGHSKVILRLEMLKRGIEILILIISLKYGVKAIAIGSLVANIISLCVNIYPNKKLLNYSYMEQLADICPALGISAVMGIIVYSIKLCGFTTYVTLGLQTSVGVIVYILLSKMFKVEAFNYFVNEIKKLLNKKNRNRDIPLR